jgi:UDP-2,3-diacylglucosamine hydrolase
MKRDHIAFLADGHLTADDPARLATLVAALEALGRTCATLCILGDLFEVWLGLDAPLPHVEAVGRALKALRADGIRTIYVEGNRDFRIGRGATRGFFDLVAEREHVEPFGECRYHLSHGDLVNRADRPYRLWRRFAKGALAPAGLGLLPDRLALDLAGWLERRLRTTNRTHKAVFPEAECQAYASERIAGGADFVLVGHFHCEVVTPLEAGGRRGTFVSLPFWHAEPKPLVFDRSGTRVSA